MLDNTTALELTLDRSESGVKRSRVGIGAKGECGRFTRTETIPKSVQVPECERRRQRKMTQSKRNLVFGEGPTRSFSQLAVAKRC